MPVISVSLMVIIFMFTYSSKIIPSAATQVKGKLIITVKEGKNWQSSIPIVLFIKKSTIPQMAFWLEDTRGNFVATIYVTRSTALQDWRAMPYEKEQIIKRPYSLPIWLHRHIRGGIHSLESCSSCHAKHRTADKTVKNDPILDSFTSATPKSGFTREWTIPPELQPGTYIFCAEINNSFDFNDTYRKDLRVTDPNYNDVSGQPSILMQGIITIGTNQAATALKLAAHGNPIGKNGGISDDLHGITTARNIIDSINVMYVP